MHSADGPSGWLVAQSAVISSVSATVSDLESSLGAELADVVAHLGERCKREGLEEEEEGESVWARILESSLFGPADGRV